MVGLQSVGLERSAGMGVPESHNRGCVKEEEAGQGDSEVRGGRVAEWKW